MNVYAVKYKAMRRNLLEAVLAKKVKKVEAAKKLLVSRVTLDQWLYRYKLYGEYGLEPQKRKKRGPAKNRTPDWVEEELVEVSEAFWWDGLEILSDRLYKETDVRLHPVTVHRVLKRRKVRYGNDWSGRRYRKPTQLYCHKQAGIELQMDTKYPFGYKQGKVMYTVIDDSTRFAYAKTYDTANGQNSLDFAKEVIKRFPFSIQKIRTDNGSEFVERNFRYFLQNQNINHRFNTPYCPEQNGKIERFHRTLNEKLIYIHLSAQDSIPEIDYKLQLFLQWYNFEKRHNGLDMNGLTPAQKLQTLSHSKNVNLTLQCNKYLQILN